MKILEYRILIAVEDSSNTKNITNIFNDPQLDTILADDFGYISNVKVDLIKTKHLEIEDRNNSLDEDEDSDVEEFEKWLNTWMKKSQEAIDEIVKERK